MTAVAAARMPSFTPLRPRILYVDDEQTNCTVARFALASTCDVATETDPERAFLRVLAEPIDLVVTDQRMPGLLGTDLAARIGLAAPGVPIIVVSAFNDVPALQRVINQHLPIKRWFCKPLIMTELAAAIVQFAEEARHLGEQASPRVCDQVLTAIVAAEAATADLVAAGIRYTRERAEEREERRAATSR